MDEPDFVVIRRGDDIPAEWNIGDLDGKWFNRAQIVGSGPTPSATARFRADGGVVSGAMAEPTGRFEVREDGAVAEVFELRPRFF